MRSARLISPSTRANSCLNHLTPNQHTTLVAPNAINCGNITKHLTLAPAKARGELTSQILPRSLVLRWLRLRRPQYSSPQVRPWKHLGRPHRGRVAETDRAPPLQDGGEPSRRTAPAFSS